MIGDQISVKRYASIHQPTFTDQIVFQTEYVHLRRKRRLKEILSPLVHPKMRPTVDFASTFQALEARGFEPLTSGFQSWRSTN